MENTYDVLILGGGIAGYVAAIRGKQLGLKVAIIERDKLGGTCLHRGCIPTKSLLQSARTFQTVLNSEIFGVLSENVQVDFSKMQARKDLVVKQLFQGLEHIFKRKKIPVYHGFGKLHSPTEIFVKLNDGKEILLNSHKAVLLATGSEPRIIQEMPEASQRVLNTDQILAMEVIPESLVIIGGGVVGVEFASLYIDLGIPVTIVEQESSLITTEDYDLQKALISHLRKRGVKILLNAEVAAITETENQVVVTLNNGNPEITSSHCLVSIGREPNSAHLGLSNTKVQLERGFVKVDDNYQTSEPNVYAIGDIIGGTMLAHAASYQAMRVMEYIAGTATVNITAPIPSCIYTNPEIASVGLTEQEAKEQGYHIKIGSFPLSANGKAIVQNQFNGFIKLIVDQATDDLLGAHIIGPSATELISTFSVGMFLDISSWELSQTVYPHPTIAEAIGESALAINSGVIHG